MMKCMRKVESEEEVNMVCLGSCANHWAPSAANTRVVLRCIIEYAGFCVGDSTRVVQNGNSTSLCNQRDALHMILYNPREILRWCLCTVMLETIAQPCCEGELTKVSHVMVAKRCARLQSAAARGDSGS